MPPAAAQPPRAPVPEVAAGAPLPLLVDRPLVLRGIGADWPLVRAAAEGPQAVAALLRAADSGLPLAVMEAPPAVEGRFFHTDNLSGFNFRHGQAPLGALMDVLIDLIPHPRPGGLYAGAAPMQAHVPELVDSHRLPMAAEGRVPRLWLGNRSRVSLHVDMSSNIAVVAAGRRRVLLFPPEATAGLYPGPLNNTPAGQPVAMVNPDAPDAARYPRYAEVAALALEAELHPGDGIVIPTLWWHAFDALEPFNLLINFWDEAQHSSGALHALVHAMLEVRDLPPPDRDAWRHWFDHFIFGESAERLAAHLPGHVESVQGPHGSAQRAAISRWLVAALSRRPPSGG